FGNALAQETSETLSQAKTLLAQKSYAAAETLLLPLKDSQSSDVFELLGTLYEFQMKHSEALTAFQQAYDLNNTGTAPDDLKALNYLYHLGDNSFNQGNLKLLGRYSAQEKILYVKITKQISLEKIFT